MLHVIADYEAVRRILEFIGNRLNEAAENRRNLHQRYTQSAFTLYVLWHTNSIDVEAASRNSTLLPRRTASAERSSSASSFGIIKLFGLQKLKVLKDSFPENSTKTLLGIIHCTDTISSLTMNTRYRWRETQLRLWIYYGTMVGGDVTAREVCLQIFGRPRWAEALCLFCREYSCDCIRQLYINLCRDTFFFIVNTKRIKSLNAEKSSDHVRCQLTPAARPPVSGSSPHYFGRLFLV